jgi:acyl carrier protein phosphodiesterase
MTSDFIKGKKQFDYPPAIQKGIQLHRAIDNFTDAHPATAAMKAFFRPQYRLYSGAFADVVYDYFLANDTNEFENEEALMNFAHTTYNGLEQYRDFFPERFARMFPYMSSQDWLSNYRFTCGIEKSFGGLVHRSAYLKESAQAFNIFTTHISEMQDHYNNFFPDVKQFANDTLAQFLKQ